MYRRLLLLACGLAAGFGAYLSQGLPVRHGSLGRVFAVQPVGPIALRITEFQYDPPGADEEREWVELANLGPEPVSLDQISLGDEALRGGREGMLRFPNGTILGPGQAVTVARTARGFRALFAFAPDFEIEDSDAAVPDMRVDEAWASGQFALANDGDEILLVDAAGQMVDGVNYGDSTTYFMPAIPSSVTGQSIQRVPADCDTHSAADWQALSPPTPGELPASATCLPMQEVPVDSGAGRLPIGLIQGPGDVSPYLNQFVAFRGIVTGLLEDQNAAGTIYYTLYVQDAPGQEDGDPATSDGVAVFHGRSRPAVNVGDLVDVRGQVTEFYGLTEIDDNGLLLQRLASGQPLPAEEVLQLPSTRSQIETYFEAREGMRVGLAHSLPVVGPTHSGCGFAVAAHSGAARPIRRATYEAPNPVVLVLSPSDVDCSDLPAVAFGDRVAGISGPLTYHFDRYKVVQQDLSALTTQVTAKAVPASPPLPSVATFRIATFNLSNYLRPAELAQDDVDGRPSTAYLAVKRRKLVQAIAAALACPELVAVQEVETADLLRDLARELSQPCGFTYTVSHLESADIRGIDLALLSDPRRVDVNDMQLRQGCTPFDTGVSDNTWQCPPGEQPLFSRPPLEVALTVDGDPLYVVVNHFKSKRGGEAETAPRRLAQAAHLLDMVRRRLDVDPLAGIVVAGDFNDYDGSTTWKRLQEGDVLIDALQDVPPENRYSYIFDGESQLIDGIFVSSSLAQRIAAAQIVHFNADSPQVIAADDGTYFAASDHDVPLIAFHGAHVTPAARPLPTAVAVPSVAPATLVQRALATDGAPPPTVTPTISVTVTPTAVARDHTPPPLPVAVAGDRLPENTADSSGTAAAGILVPAGLIFLGLLSAAAVALMRRR